MRRVLAATLAVAVAVVLAPTAAPTRQATPALDRALGRALATTNVDPGRTGALAVDLSTGAVVFQSNADRGLVPASAEKLAVSFTALRVLGPRFRFRTEVVGVGSRSGRVWRGDLGLVGFGDPTLTIADLDRLARRFAATGIRRVAGRVFGDDTHFDSRRDAPGWKPSYLGIESRPLSALAVAGVEFVGANGSASAAAFAFTDALRRRGIAVTGRATSGRAPADALSIVFDLSDPLAIVVRRLNADSDNFVAEMVLKELGATIVPRGSTASGARVVRYDPVRGGRLVGGRTHRGRVGTLALRSVHGYRPRRNPPRRRCRSHHPRRVRVLPRRRRGLGNDAEPARHATDTRACASEDGDDAARVRTRRVRPAPVRLRDPPEREAGGLLGCPLGAGPLRPGPSASLATPGDRPPRGRARRASRPSAPWSRGSRRRSRPSSSSRPTRRPSRRALRARPWPAPVSSPRASR